MFTLHNFGLKKQFRKMVDSCLQSKLFIKFSLDFKTVSLFIVTALCCILLLKTLSPDHSDCTLNDLQMLDSMGSRDTNLLLHVEHRIVVHPKMDFTADVVVPMVIMVNTMSSSEERRNHIRSSWMKWTDELNIKVYFFAGITPDTDYYENELETLKQENEEHGDLIVAEFKESYYRLTLKTLRMMEWYSNTFYNGTTRPAFFLKTDDDVFLNIPRIVDLIMSDETKQTLQDEGYFVAGRVYENPPIETNRSSKYFISSKFWLEGETRYPTYVEGPCYVLSQNIVHQIFNAAKSVPLFPFEDVYITGMVLGEKLGMKRFRNVTTYNDYSLQFLGDSKLMTEAFAIHPVYDPELMSEIFTSYVEGWPSSDSENLSIDWIPLLVTWVIIIWITTF